MEGEATSADTEPTGFTPADRERLRTLLLRDGFLRLEDGVPLRGADGSPRAWMLCIWGVSATGSGARLIARALV